LRRDQVRPGDAGRYGELARQAATREAAAHGRPREDVEGVEEPLLGRGDRVEAVAPDQHSDVVLLELGVTWIAREADGVEECRRACAEVDRLQPLPLRGHVAPEVGQAPGDGETEAGRSRRVAGLELDQGILELRP